MPSPFTAPTGPVTRSSADSPPVMLTTSGRPQPGDIVVEGKRIRTYVDDRLVVDYTEPDDVTPPENHPLRYLSSGTFAFQGHDPESRVYYRNIMVRPLPD